MGEGRSACPPSGGAHLELGDGEAAGVPLQGPEGVEAAADGHRHHRGTPGQAHRRRLSRPPPSLLLPFRAASPAPANRLSPRPR